MDRPALILLDLDGVLVDSRASITRSIDFALARVGAPRPPLRELERWIGPPLLEAFVALAGHERAPAAVAAYRERYAIASLEETRIAPGMREALARIAGGATAAVATSKPRAFAVPVCERLGLARHLALVEGPGLDTPGEAKAQTIARALARLDARPAVMVGDRRHDVAGAHANGLPCVGVLWGIGSRAELEAAGADAIVATPDALLSVLSASLYSDVKAD